MIALLHPSHTSTGSCECFDNRTLSILRREGENVRNISYFYHRKFSCAITFRNLNPTIRLLAIDDHPLILDGLRSKFRLNHDSIVVTCTAASVEEAIAGNRDTLFDMILLDLYLPDTDPLENIGRLIRRFPGKPVVILTGEENIYWKVMTAKAGARAYLTKIQSRKEMVAQLNRVAAGENLLQEHLMTETGSSETSLDSRYFILKPTDIAILRKLADGIPQKNVARDHNLTQSALEKRLKVLRKQFQVANTLELIRVCEQLRLLNRYYAQSIPER
ncbi:MAG TPA: response regulator transcription factor [Bacteroidales bacterium]|nr:response regulator transcription factor [Bacteroidales bacterium]